MVLSANHHHLRSGIAFNLEFQTYFNGNQGGENFVRALQWRAGGRIDGSLAEMEKENSWPELSGSVHGGRTAQEDGKHLSPFFGVACAFAALGLAVRGTMSARENEVAEINRLLKKVDEAEAEVAEMKRRRSEDAKANEKVVAMFATRQQQWQAEKKRLKRQVEILLKKSEGLRTAQQTPSSCLECAQKDEAVSDLEKKLGQMEDEIVETLHRMESCKKECRIMLEESKEITERLSLQVVRLQKDADEKEEIICSLLRKSEEKEELERELTMAEAKRKQADWTGLERFLHSAHVKQRHLQEVDVFERQMRAKDERLEAFRWKLLSMESELEKLKSQNQNLVLNLQREEEKTASLEALLNEKDGGLKSSKQRTVFEAKSKRTSAIEESCRSYLRGKELAAAKPNKPREKDDEAEIFKAEKDLETGFDEEGYQLSVVEEKSFQTRMQYGEEAERRQRMQSHIMKGKSVPKIHLPDRIVGERGPDVKNAVEIFSADIDEAGDQVLQVENPHLKCLIEQATRESKSWFHVSSLKGMLQAVEEKLVKSAANRVSRPFKREQKFAVTESHPHQELPTVVDKHVSETCTSGDGTERRAVYEIVVPGKLHSGPAFLSGWQNDRATTSLDSEPWVSMLGHQGQSKGKTVSQNPYWAHKNAEMSLDEDSANKIAQRQNTEESTTPEQTAPLSNFLARKKDDPRHDTSSYWKHGLAGRDSSWKKDGEALAVSSEVKRLKQLLLQLEKMSKTEVSERPKSKDGKPIMDTNTENRNETQEVQSNQMLISAIQSLKKQVKRHQALAEKIDDLCTRMHEKVPVQTINQSRTKEQTAAQELFLIEAFQLQQHVVATGQKLMTTQSDITRNLSGINNKLAEPVKPNVRQSIEIAKNQLKEIQRSLEIRLARIIGDLEGMLARNGILHVMPLEWKRENGAKVGKSKTRIAS